MSKVGELAIEIEKEEIAFNHSLHDIEHETIDTTWDIRVEGKLNKNNIIFKDKKYKELYLDMKKVDDKLKEKTMNITSILVWLKVHNIAQIQYQSKQDDDFKYYDFITDKHYSRNQIIKLAKKSGYKDEQF